MLEKGYLQLFAQDVGTLTQAHASHLDICNTVTSGVEMLCHRKSRGVVTYASTPTLIRFKCHASPTTFSVCSLLGFIANTHS